MKVPNPGYAIINLMMCVADDEDFNGTLAWEKMVAQNKAAKLHAKEQQEEERREKQRVYQERVAQQDLKRREAERLRLVAEQTKARRKETAQFRQKLLAHALYALMKKRRFEYVAMIEKSPRGIGLSLQVSDQMVDNCFVGKEITVKGRSR